MEEQPKEITLDEVRQALLDDAVQLEQPQLYRLSGLEAPDIETLSAFWDQISSDRRQSLLDELETLADSNTTMDFDSVARVALADENPITRTTALRILWECEDPKLIPDLVNMLENDDDQNVRAQAASTMGHFLHLGELSKIPPDSMSQAEDALLAVMESEDHPEVRRQALESLGYSGREAVRGHIEEAYEYGDEEWQASALAAMGRSADREWEPEVLEKLDHVNELVREEAARAAGELELEMAAAALFQMLEHEEEEVRMAAAWSLSQIGGNDVQEALENQLEFSESDAETSLVEDAIENLVFTEELEDLSMLEFSEDQLEPPLDEPED
ncbi:MAG: HEAT repeat domain-containing protein [Chloroflexi bacterium]|nr:MAG: HEAT repeat domain-containing protein [Chloroflexota bacterium]MBL1193429.1 HEAT repeat domain-containing protein [Chloroflexota bacterium]NOH10721.1 HEAT repeat domain-containing protein [Chloroflexota bacterium]